MKCIHCCQPIPRDPKKRKRAWTLRKFCSPKCDGASRRSNVEERFWKKVNKTETCWHYTGGKTHFGYGAFMIHKDGKKYLEGAHRFSYALAFGPIPEGLRVLHRCDVPGCVNPDHLFLGTQLDNMRDMYSKGRGRTGKPQRGELSAKAKLTWDQVREIRRLYPSLEQKELAKRFGVKQANISRIILGVIWREADAPRPK
jgi:HNH endonuclease